MSLELNWIEFPGVRTERQNTCFNWNLQHWGTVFPLCRSLWHHRLPHCTVPAPSLQSLVPLAVPNQSLLVVATNSINPAAKHRDLSFIEQLNQPCIKSFVKGLKPFLLSILLHLLPYSLVSSCLSSPLIILCLFSSFTPLHTPLPSPLRSGSIWGSGRQSLCSSVQRRWRRASHFVLKDGTGEAFLSRLGGED